MDIRLEYLLPYPLKEQDIGSSGIWDQPELQLSGGKLYQLHAASGKGKTTLLSIIYGLRSDYEGKVSLDARDIREITEPEWPELRKRGFSFIFQGLELFPDLSARDNILLKNRQTDFASSREIDDMSEHLGLAPFMDRKAGILSFGQQQRVALIRALCQPFDLLLADEPFSHMDLANQELALELINRACEQRGAGCLLTSLGNTKVHPSFNVLSL